MSRLCIRGSRGSSAPARVSAALGYGTLRPASMPPQAVLIVRRMGDPLPGRAVGPMDRALRPEWERAAVASLDRFRARAIRAAVEPVPPSADAVYFSDESELLAALVVDCHHGVHRDRWWWKGIARWLGARSLPRPAAVLTARSNAAPAVIARLVASEAGVAALAGLDDADVEEVGRAIAAACEIDAAVLIPLPATARDAPRVTGHAAVPAEFTDPGAKSVVADRQLRPPWTRVMTPACRSMLRPSVERLVGVAMVAWTSPGAARSVEFARAVQAWWTSVTQRSTRALHQPDVHTDNVSQPRRSSADPVVTAPAVRPSSRKADVTRASKRTAASPPGGASPGRLRPHDNQRRYQRVHRAVKHAHPSTPRRTRPRDSVPARGAAAATADGIARADGSAYEAGAETRLGGAFYLINLMAQPELSAPLEGAGIINRWRLLGELTRALLGRRASRYRNDALWGVLEALADGALQDAGRVRRDKAAAAWARRAVPAALAAATRAFDRSAHSGVDVERWLATAARVHTSPTHVDVMFPLQSISLAVRAAGLDRDPGWVPELGRIVLFHFD